MLQASIKHREMQFIIFYKVRFTVGVKIVPRNGLLCETSWEASNYYWEGTPLLTLYQKHKDVLGKEWEDAVTGAAKDSGWLLKRVIEDDKRNFKTKKEGLGKNV